MSARLGTNDFTSANLSGACVEGSFPQHSGLLTDFTNANLTGLRCFCEEMGAEQEVVCGVEGSLSSVFPFCRAIFANTTCPDGVTVADDATDCGGLFVEACED